MMRYTRLAHQFISHIPEHLDPGVLYISLEYGTAAHSCCCGCGEEVITPLTPTDWKLTFDGETVSLHPSIGSWSLECRSHYFVRCGRIVEAGSWSDERVAVERLRDKAAKAAHYASDATLSADIDPIPVLRKEPTSFWRRLWAKIVRGG